MKAVVTGSRGWEDEAAIERRLGCLPAGSTVIHGGARGADRLAGAVARRLGLAVIEEPADWRVKPDTPPGAIRRRGDGTRYDVRAGHQRNALMFDKHGPIDVVFAFRLRGSSGASGCIAEAHARNVPVEIDDR